SALALKEPFTSSGTPSLVLVPSLEFVRMIVNSLGTLDEAPVPSLEPSACRVESSVLDYVKDELVSLFLPSHSGINPHVCGTDLDSVSFGNPSQKFSSNNLKELTKTNS
nr:hypothetical protein [Tanacetum cinerariifolium]